MSSGDAGNPKAKHVVSMRDVAAEAGVSRMAVSRALRPGTPIRPELRARILSVVERLGYRTDPLVTELMTSFVERRPVRHRETLAVVWWKPRWVQAAQPGTFAAGIRAGLAIGAARHGCSLDDFIVDGASAQSLGRTLKARGIHGMIFTPPPSHDTPTPRLDWRQFSVMVIGSSLREPMFSRVHHHHFAACVEVLRRLRERGFRRPLLLLGTDREERMMRAYAGAFIAQEAGPPSHILHLRSVDARELGRRLARLRFDVIVADINDWVPVLATLPRTAGIGVVSLDVLREAGTISGIFQNVRHMSEYAVDLLMQARLRHAVGVPAEPVSLLTPGVWVEGATLARGASAALTNPRPARSPGG